MTAKRDGLKRSQKKNWEKISIHHPRLILAVPKRYLVIAVSLELRRGKPRSQDEDYKGRGDDPDDLGPQGEQEEEVEGHEGQEAVEGHVAVLNEKAPVLAVEGRRTVEREGCKTEERGGYVPDSRRGLFLSPFVTDMAQGQMYIFGWGKKQFFCFWQQIAQWSGHKAVGRMEEWTGEIAISNGQVISLSTEAQAGLLPSRYLSLPSFPHSIFSSSASFFFSDAIFVVFVPPQLCHTFHPSCQRDANFRWQL